MGVSGKTKGLARGKQGMITHPSRVADRPAPCQSAGPPLDVVEWRSCRLREAGFAPALADSLARKRIDLHALLELVDAGCPPELAARILSPLDDADDTDITDDTEGSAAAAPETLGAVEPKASR
ncbi:MAG TPA: hypothetical protein VFN43_03730 [Humibacillus sp.]|nr:hypothetical protein [Humibacillus sp.]